MRTSHIPIVLLTAKADHASKIEGLTRGADVYLPKPFNREELLIRLEKLIEPHQPAFATIESKRFAAVNKPNPAVGKSPLDCRVACRQFCPIEINKKSR